MSVQSSLAEDAVLGLIPETELVALASDLVAAGGENPGGTEAATVQVLADFARAAGLEVAVTEVAPGRPNLTAMLPGGTRPGLLFLGHSDVVPAGVGWDRPAFDPYVRDGRLVGRGSTDMKGGLAAVLIALRALRAAGVELSGPMALACTVDEEDLGLGIRAFTAAAGPFPYSACVVAEPTDLETVIACRGDSYLELTVTGKPAHSGRPADGRNAIDAAARILDLIRRDHARLQGSADPLLGAGSWNAGLIRGGTGTSMVAGSCTLSLDRRLMPDEDPEVIREALLADIRAAGIAADGMTVDAAVTMEMPGFHTEPDHPLVANAVGALAQLGMDSPVTGWTAACDGGFIARDFGVPVIVMGPGGLNDQAHQVNESVSVTELVTAAKAYALMCLRHRPIR
ncbi:M20 family metallopeptidase [Arthrobacter sp. 7Tela_A1]|uniref:M20 family metallopeptidase n=1 Tax=Arthrobacter sp. 7Tela_A1 TaxID=3093745 RepID=UPI003BB5DFF9